MKFMSLLFLILVTSNLFAQEIKVTNAFVRLLPPSSPTTGAFMTLTNTSEKSIKLIKAESDCCNKVELHTHTMVDGMMRMREVESMEIPAKGQTELKPGSLHIMLIGLKKPLALNQQIPLTLIFDDKKRMNINAEVKAI